MQIPQRKCSEARPMFQTPVETHPYQVPKDPLQQAADRLKNWTETALMIESVTTDIGVGD